MRKVSNSPINILSRVKKKININLKNSCLNAKNTQKTLFFTIKEHLFKKTAISFFSFFEYNKVDSRGFRGLLFLNGENMDYLVINENKLKIMLTPKDVCDYGIECEKSDYSKPETRKAFWRVLDKAREECGFKVSGEKLLIQYYPSKSGAEIFVTKLGKISVGVEKSITSSDSIAMLSSKNMIYRFSSLEELERLCRETVKKGADCGADVYYSEDGSYYLFFEERCDFGVLSPFSIASEFAEEVPQNMESYIKEHSEALIVGKAFSLLGMKN